MLILPRLAWVVQVIGVANVDLRETVGVKGIDDVSGTDADDRLQRLCGTKSLSPSSSSWVRELAIILVSS